MIFHRSFVILGFLCGRGLANLACCHTVRKLDFADATVKFTNGQCYQRVNKNDFTFSYLSTRNNVVITFLTIFRDDEKKKEMKKEFSALEWVFLFLLICMSNNRPSSIALISLLAHHSAPCIDHKPCTNIVMRINIPLRWIFQNVRITNLLLQVIEKPQTQGAVTRVIAPSVAGIVSKMPQVHGCLPHAHLRTGATHALLVG